MIVWQCYLKETIRFSAAPGETYYLYFPYEKDPATTGLDNTDFSVYFTCEHTAGEINTLVKCGDVVADENGVCEKLSARSEAMRARSSSPRVLRNSTSLTSVPVTKSSVRIVSQVSAR